MKLNVHGLRIMLEVPILLLITFGQASSSFQAHSRVTTNLRKSLDFQATGNPRENDYGNPNDMRSIERDVVESANARLDLQRVSKALLYDDNSTLDQKIQPSSKWTIPFAASIACGSATYFMLHSWLISLGVLFGVFVVAAGDPVEEDDIAGSLARVVGRVTINTYEVSKPKIKAVARAALTEGDDITLMQAEIDLLRSENESLKLWKQQREAVDSRLNEFDLARLKELARYHGIKIGGTKYQLLIRLVEAGVVEIK